MTGFRAVQLPIFNGATPKCTLGGDPFLPIQQETPRCRNCGRRQLLFLQFDIDETWQLPFATGSHVVIFMCPHCNEIPSFTQFPKGRLPARFWNETEGHFFVAMFAPGHADSVCNAEPLLLPWELRFEELNDNAHPSDIIRIGGTPHWLQAPERVFCCCGAEMALICQIAESFEFRKQIGAPVQPDTFSADAYCLFLGNEVYVFGCPNQCDPRAVWVVVQG